MPRASSAGVCEKPDLNNLDSGVLADYLLPWQAPRPSTGELGGSDQESSWHETKPREPTVLSKPRASQGKTERNLGCSPTLTSCEMRGSGGQAPWLGQRVLLMGK